MKYTLFFLLFPLFLFSQKESDLSLILKKHAQAMGGLEQWRQFDSHLIVHEMEVKGKKAKSTLSMKKPDKFRIDFETDGMHRVKAYDGANGWILLNDELEPMPEGEDKEMAEEAVFYSELVLAQDMGHQLELVATELLDGKKVYKIKLTKSETDEQYYFINSQTFLCEMVAEYSEDISWEGVYFKTTFDDYRMVDGLLFPFKMSLYADDDLLRNYFTTSIKINLNIDEEVFNKDIALIKRNAKRFSKSLVDGDIDAVVGAYTKDAKIFPNNREILEGEEAIRQYWTPPPNRKSQTSHHLLLPLEIEILGDTANDFGYYEGISINSEGTESHWKGKYVVVWKKVGPDDWRMYLDIWNSVK